MIGEAGQSLSLDGRALVLVETVSGAFPRAPRLCGVLLTPRSQRGGNTHHISHDHSSLRGTRSHSDEGIANQPQVLVQTRSFFPAPKHNTRVSHAHLPAQPIKCAHAHVYCNRDVGCCGVSVRAGRTVFSGPGSLGMALHCCSGEERESRAHASLQPSDSASGIMDLGSLLGSILDSCRVCVRRRVEGETRRRASGSIW